ncbi:MAG: response regulator [Lachnospiraceae bacterium]|nr:response regulator [Lachnospiraceae bacterium]
MSKIVLVTNHFSVIVKGLEKKLKDLQHQVKMVNNGFLAVSEDDYKSDVIILYLPDTVPDNNTLLKEINVVCDKGFVNNCGIILIGSAKIHDQFLKESPMLSGFIWMNQPIDINLLSEKIEKEAKRVKGGTSSKKLLIVDDDPVYGTMVSNWLKEDYTVYTVTDGMQTISFLTNNSVDLILLDYEMPVVDGAQILQLLRSHDETKDIPVIFLTGVQDKESIQRVLKLKPEGYILKAATKGEIVKILSDHFRKKDLT